MKKPYKSLLQNLHESRNKYQQLTSKPQRIIREQTNPFTGGGTGPNWAAAEAAWQSWNSTNQGGSPQPDSTFLNNMDNKGCSFYQARLTAQVNSFVDKFGGQFGTVGSSNPAWQSQKYARIMWLANAVQNCSGQSTGTVSCINSWINDSTNDSLFTSAVCNNGNQAISPENMEQTKFRWQSIADCSMLDNKIDEFAALILTSTGCNQVRKQTKHDYLESLKNSCC
jgi:hypothetical protein